MVAQIYYARQGKVFGPVRSSDLQDLVASGAILPGDMLWKPEANQWVPISSIPGLFLTAITAAPIASVATVSGYTAENLMPGERLVCVARRHWAIIVFPLIVLVFGFLMLIIGLAIRDGAALVFLGAVLSLAGISASLLGLLAYLSTEFSLTDRRILIKEGILSTHLREMPLTKVEAIRVAQGLFGSIFGYGTVVLTGSGGTKRRCLDIHNPMGFYKRVQEQVAYAQLPRSQR
jgi:membrane protein YdbS with pleckstrin-like domain